MVVAAGLSTAAAGADEDGLGEAARSTSGSTVGPPGRAPGHGGQCRLAGQAGVEVIERADLALGEGVVVDRVLVEAAVRVLSALLRQHEVERRLPVPHCLPVGVGVR